jgi:hypothetical protein
VFILAPNDGTARAIADAFATDTDVSNYVVTGQDAEKASVQYIIDGRQSMTVFKDVRTLVNDAINAAIALLQDQEPEARGAYNNGVIDVPAIQSPVVTVDRNNVISALINSGYYTAADFTGLDAIGSGEVTADVVAGKVGIVCRPGMSPAGSRTKLASRKRCRRPDMKWKSSLARVTRQESGPM